MRLPRPSVGMQAWAADTARSCVSAALVSRQFVDMSRIRIEGLLAAFPKLVGTGKQHTYVETENVRYLYQPLEVREGGGGAPACCGWSWSCSSKKQQQPKSPMAVLHAEHVPRAGDQQEQQHIGGLGNPALVWQGRA